MGKTLAVLASLALACASGGTVRKAAPAPAAEEGPLLPSRSEPPCPPTFASASGACAQNGTAHFSACEYPEGRCFCRAPSVCSGVPRPPPPASAYRWECQVGPTRPDGCPWESPGEGTPCAGSRTCSYATCGGPIYQCVNGRWALQQMVSPPG